MRISASIHNADASILSRESVQRQRSQTQPRSGINRGAHRFYSRAMPGDAQLSRCAAQRPLPSMINRHVPRQTISLK